MNELAQSVFEKKAALPDSLKDVDTGSRIMVGQFANYETRDMVGDLSTKGMFDRTWKETKSRVKHVHEHDMSKPIGKIQDMWEDGKGAYYKSVIPKGKEGDKYLEWAEGGLLDEHSFGFKTIRAKKTSDGKRDLLEVKHFEVTSVSGWAIHGDTPLLMVKKGVDPVSLLENMNNRYKKLEKLLYSSNAADEDIEDMQHKAGLLLLEIKQLHQHIIDLTASSTPAAEEAPEPRKETIDYKSVLAFIEIQKQLITV